MYEKLEDSSMLLCCAQPLRLTGQSVGVERTDAQLSLSFVVLLAFSHLAFVLETQQSDGTFVQGCWKFQVIFVFLLAKTQMQRYDPHITVIS